MAKRRGAGPVLAFGAALMCLAPRPVGAVEPAPAPNAVQHVHDPHAYQEGAYTYVFSTGPGVMIRRSLDLVHWESVGRVFPGEIPAWAKEAVPKAKGDSIWAPDITRRNGRYLLYYCVSSFGSNTSVIGLATNTTLDPNAKDYRWEDQGRVWASVASDGYNAIDPAFVDLSKGRSALAFGSFWSGIKYLPLDDATGKPAPGAQLEPLAQRPNHGAIEAPAIAKLGRYYYLFVSFDLCCRGVNSTYNIRVGRSLKPDGPYVDKDGVPLMEGGGTLLLGTEGRVIGPGHQSVLRRGRITYLVYHFYDGDANGVPTLQLRPMSIGSDGWPVLGKPVM